MISLRTAVLAVAAAAPLLAQTPPPATEKKPEPPRVLMTRYVMTAGDITGDGMAEAIVYDTDSKAIRVIGYDGAAPLQIMGLFVKDVVTEMTVADLDGDGKGELVTGEGLLGYNPREGPQTDVTIKIYKPDTKGDWSPVEIYRKATERPDVTSIKVTDLDGDGPKEIVFGYMASKYMADLRVAKRAGESWAISELPTIRMAMHIDVGDVLHDGRKLLVVGRAYGDPPSPDTTTAIGDAFVLDGEKRIPLPVTRGVSSVAVGDVDGDGRDEIVVGDGWHANYGKLARSRIAIISRQGTAWKYDLIEDLQGHMRFEQIDLVDLDGDGQVEIIARAGQNDALGGSVRVYERTGSAWRGMTAARLVQTHAAGNFNDDKKLELVFAGQPPLPFSLAESAAPAWETKLGEAVETRDVDPKSLLDKAAPPLKVTEWVGSDPTTLRDLRGKVVLLDFWATWCKPCIDMYPEMREWVKEFGSDLVILGITNHSRQTSAQVRRFFNRQKLPWPVAIDPNNRTHVDYGVSPIPHTFLIDRRGVVRLEHRGGGDLTVIKNRLRELIAEKPARASE